MGQCESKSNCSGVYPNLIDTDVSYRDAVGMLVFVLSSNHLLTTGQTYTCIA